MRSPETYVEHACTENFASAKRMARDSRRIYNPPARPALNQWGLGGSWNIDAERATLESALGEMSKKAVEAGVLTRPEKFEAECLPP